ncbi:hypothetical protein [Brevundimonas sp. SL161]|uniref:hypothetical protein n=1 Tax=Brevundimonas sp. SL161 TaxID=2804613 RepID=UPI003CEEC4FB
MFVVLLETSDGSRSDDDPPSRIVTSVSQKAKTAEQHGAEFLQAWVAEVTGAPGVITPENLSDAVRQRFGEALDDLLRDP